MKRILCTVLLAALVLMLASCGLQVPRPEIKEGRFNFSVTYEIKGETNTFSAVYVCEFNGTNWSVDGGYSRDWDIHVEGDYEGDNYSAILGKVDDGGSIHLHFGLYPEYFMGDPETGDWGLPEPSIAIVYPENELGEMIQIGDPIELERDYGIRIVSYEYDEPIANTFGLFK